LGTVVTIALAEPTACDLATEHAGVSFSFQDVDDGWACRLQTIIDNPTTINRVGPMTTSLPPVMYGYLLDHPPLAAGLINRLDLGLYKSEVRGPSRFWGDDGEGTRGIVHLVYQNTTARIYYLEGTHDSRFLSQITGRAVVFLKMTPVTDADGMDAMDTTIVAYTKLDNGILSGLLSVLRPLVGGIVTKKLQKGMETVDQLGQLMRHQPERVLFEAMDPPAFESEHVAFLRESFETLRKSGTSPRAIPSP